MLLAFVFNEVWTQYNTAAQSINRECGALHGAAMLANAIPNRAGRPVNERIADYGRTVVAVEWPMMAQRRRSPEAAQAFRMALDTAARVPVTERADVAMRSQIVQLLTQAHAERETRTFQISRGVPWAMWTVLILLDNRYVPGSSPPVARPELLRDRLPSARCYTPRRWLEY